jgi:hypothetical protein
MAKKSSQATAIQLMRMVGEVSDVTDDVDEFLQGHLIASLQPWM